MISQRKHQDEVNSWVDVSIHCVQEQKKLGWKQILLDNFYYCTNHESYESILQSN